MNQLFLSFLTNYQSPNEVILQQKLNQALLVSLSNCYYVVQILKILFLSISAPITETISSLKGLLPRKPNFDIPYLRNHLLDY